MSAQDIIDAEDAAYQAGLADGKQRMRERAAKVVEEMTLQLSGNVSIRDQVVLTIRSLPVDGDER